MNDKEKVLDKFPNAYSFCFGGTKIHPSYIWIIKIPGKFSSWEGCTEADAWANAAIELERKT
jgi:hypothetical protein